MLLFKANRHQDIAIYGAAISLIFIHISIHFLHFWLNHGTHHFEGITCAQWILIYEPGHICAMGSRCTENKDAAISKLFHWK